MRNLKDRLVQFMYGRYGVDQLYYALFGLYFVLLVINSFARSILINALMWADLILMIYRVFSKNIYKRRLENEKFLKLWYRIKPKLTLAMRRLKEIKTHRYRKCPHCKSNLRLPRRKGKLIVNCPRCHKDFNMKILI